MNLKFGVNEDLLSLQKSLPQNSQNHVIRSKYICVINFTHKNMTYRGKYRVIVATHIKYSSNE